MRKIALVLLAVLLFDVFAAACSNGQKSGDSDTAPSASTGEDSSGSADATDATAEKPVTIKYVVPGSEPKEWKAVQAEVNNKLLADGVNVQIEKEYIDWGAWEQKINLKLSTSDEFDMFHVMNDQVSLANYAARGALKDITAEIEQFGPNLQKYIPESVWSGVTKEGKIYGVPAYWYESSVDGSITVNKYWLKKAGAPTEFKTREEMLDAFEQVNKTLGMKMTFPIRGGAAGPADIFQRLYDSYPFTVRDNIAYIGQDGVVKNWVETEEFKQDAQWFRDAYKRKLLDPDVLTVKQEQMDKQIQSGEWVFLFGTPPNTLPELQKTYPDIQDSDIELMRFNPDGQAYRMVGAKNINVVAANSKNPEACVKFLNWLYENQDNYDLFLYGIEGKTYNKDGEKGKQTILDEATKQPLYEHPDWMVGNLNYIRVDESKLSANKELFKSNPSASNFFAADFFFDPSPVKSEMANVQAVFTSDVTPIYRGVIDFDSNIKSALDKLKAAGIDKVLAEYQKQLDAYKASK
ncbi:extracellular solute-binding protein [Paenibacillus thermotolerans]|uniref:extracellular solute-binding protein n=1 Tax=Paenibacillus thermotolerans TaxID=3027807 RepID=UPI0023680222|nr:MULTISPECIES: extracellular solute-binding protein [unclassified Paenibacillus]